MKYKCCCGDINKINFANFRQGRKCRKCGTKKTIQKTKHSFNYVYNYFKKHNCELLETKYKNNHTVMNYRCNCGNKSTITFGNFKNGKRCNRCGCKRRGETKKFKLEYVRQFFKDNDCELLEQEYKDNKSKMKYKCKCGNISTIRFAEFIKGNRCRKCSGCEKYNFKYVKKYFQDNSCKLLEQKYINNATKMTYECKCGNISTIRFADFKRGMRCRKCGFDKIRGSNHYLYNPNITEKERIYGRNSIEYIKWRNSIYIRDNYTCQMCDKIGGRLNAHHIESWASNEKLRLVESNGITFCENCHKQFNKEYGNRNNNRRQLNEFLMKSSLQSIS